MNFSRKLTRCLERASASGSSKGSASAPMLLHSSFWCRVVGNPTKDPSSSRGRHDFRHSGNYEYYISDRGETATVSLFFKCKAARMPARGCQPPCCKVAPAVITPPLCEEAPKDRKIAQSPLPSQKSCPPEICLRPGFCFLWGK